MNLASSSYHYQPVTDIEERDLNDAELRDHIERLQGEFPGYGYRRLGQQLRREGIVVNDKKIRRVQRKYQLFPNVQFFFNETKPLQQVSSFRLGDSRCENPLVDVEKRPPYLPQDQRYGPDPCLDIPPQTGLSPDIAFAPSTLFASPESFVSSH